MLHADDRTICSTCHVHAIISTPTAMIMILITCKSRRCTWCWQCLTILTVNACRYWFQMVSRWILALFWYSNVFEYIDLLKWIKDLQSSTILFVRDWCALIDQDVMINHETCLASTTPETCTFGQVSRLGDAFWKFMIAMIPSPKINRIASQKWKKVVGFDYPGSYPILLEWSLLMGGHSFILRSWSFETCGLPCSWDPWEGMDFSMRPGSGFTGGGGSKLPS